LKGESLCPSEKKNPREGRRTVRINLLPEKPEAGIWRNLEKAVRIFWFLLPFVIFLWAKVVMNSK
jgi:hypothetical protein